VEARLKRTLSDQLKESVAAAKKKRRAKRASVKEVARA
jgi:hypothetical protein